MTNRLIDIHCKICGRYLHSLHPNQINEGRGRYCDGCLLDDESLHMNTFGTNGYTFHYDPDLSGTVTIRNTEGGATSVIQINGMVLVDFVVECYFKPNILKSIEESTVDELIRKYGLS